LRFTKFEFSLNSFSNYLSLPVWLGFGRLLTSVCNLDVRLRLLALEALIAKYGFVLVSIKFCFKTLDPPAFLRIGLYLAAYSASNLIGFVNESC
jgi:hypothetical protein